MNTFARRLLGGAVAATGAWLVTRTVLQQSRRFSFRDRVVLITGGSRGLGLILARQLAHEGASVGICARSSAELDTAFKELQQIGNPVAAFAGDITHQHEVAKIVRHVEEELGPIDVLINNAGMIQVGPLEEMTSQDYERAMAVHFWAPLYAMEAVLPQMRRRGEGRIVNISSIGGRLGVPHLAPYCASKFALRGLSEGLRAELANEGIYLTTVCPGTMRTGSHYQAKFKGRHREEFFWFSIGASAPLLSMSADRAARKIIEACRVGRAELTMPLSAQLAACASAIAPELMAEVKGLIARALPSPVGPPNISKHGYQSTSAWSPSILTILGDRAARRNNEL